MRGFDPEVNYHCSVVSYNYCTALAGWKNATESVLKNSPRSMLHEIFMCFLLHRPQAVCATAGVKDLSLIWRG